MSATKDGATIKVVPAGKDLVIVMNKHALLNLKTGKSYSVELVSGDRKMKVTFMRDTTFGGLQAKLAREKEKLEAQAKLKDVAKGAQTS